MVVSIFIIAISVFFLVYWVRYSCLMLLRGAQERSPVLTGDDERFSAFSVIERLKTEADLAPLERALDRDYRVVAYFIEHAADLELACIENKLLILDYRMMRLWSRVTRTLAPQQSREALSEMASVLGVLVAQMGQPGRVQTEA